MEIKMYCSNDVVQSSRVAFIRGMEASDIEATECPGINVRSCQVFHSIILVTINI